MSGLTITLLKIFTELVGIIMVIVRTSISLTRPDYLHDLLCGLGIPVMKALNV